MGKPAARRLLRSKGGVIAFTRAVAREVAKTGVLVNAVAPAAIDAGFAARATDE